jgi:DNA-binding protein H-NS
MKDRPDFNSMTIDELWSLHKQFSSELARQIVVEKTRLDQRLRQLAVQVDTRTSTARRPYPRVLPKYRNPEQPGETWSGRGKQPRWLTAKLRSGKKLEDFRIQPSKDHSRPNVR